MTDAPAAVEWSAVAVRYPYAERMAVGPISLELLPGERLLLLGPSGCGKSTLLGTVTGLVPTTIPAELSGTVTTLGVPAGERAPAEWSAHVAQLFQDAEQTLCGMTVRDEIAFALENRALPPDEIERRIRSAMDRCGVPAAWLERRTATLSGGEKQIVALAAALAQHARIFIADEPTAHLAHQAATRLHEVLAESGQSVLVVDHRLDGLIGEVDRVAVIGRDGTLLTCGSPRELFRRHGERLAREGIWRPLACDLDRRLAEAGLCLFRAPLTVGEAIDDLDRLPPEKKGAARAVVADFVVERIAARAMPSGEVVGLTEADCAPLFASPVLRNISLSIAAGETVAVLGRNGAGKSTLGASLAGLLRLKGGERRGPACGFAFQRPESQFTEASVRAELESVAGKDDAEHIDGILDTWRLKGVERQHPYELSQGQKRRLALAVLTADERWPLLVLDEPTAGLDSAAVEELAGRIAALAEAGRAVVVITHDLDFALRSCARGVVLEGGNILADEEMPRIARDDALLAQAGLAQPELARLMNWLEQTPC